MNDIDTMSFIDSIASGMKMYYVREERLYPHFFATQNDSYGGMAVSCDKECSSDNLKLMTQAIVDSECSTNCLPK